ncbi:hypothetical protein HanRHA438_Chr03g0144511 [Helianthus annuus]|nr:hypothetical protein HanRHA438_Chr03g0144511 [Helianthus annuus]
MKLFWLVPVDCFLRSAWMTRLSARERTWSSLVEDRSQSTPAGWRRYGPEGDLVFLVK